jgi:hypothetical protein
MKTQLDTIATISLDKVRGGCGQPAGGAAGGAGKKRPGAPGAAPGGEQQQAG